MPELRRLVGAVLLASSALALVSCASARVDVPEETGAVPAGPVKSSAPPRTTPWVETGQTGVPAGTSLMPSGGLKITEDGTVVDGLDIAGCVDVDADDVVIRNTRITCDDPRRTLVVASGGSGLVIEHSEIDGSGVVEVGVGWSDYTLRFVNVHGVNDGVRFGHRVTVEDSWIHDMARIGDLHPDAMQTTSASEVVIRGNVLDPRHADSGDLTNAAIMLGSETGTQKVVDVLVEDNLLDGGNYTLNIRGDISADRIRIQDNTFGGGARYGEVQAPDSVPLGEGNVDASGAPVVADRAD